MIRRPILAIAFALAAACSTSREGGSRQAPVSTPQVSATERSDPPITLPPSREVRFQTSDGITIVGTLQPGTRPDAPLVIFAHQLAGNRDEFAPLLERLHAPPAIATLTIDLRGHGASTVGREGSISFREFARDMWPRMREDVMAAQRFAASDESGIRPARIAVVGASIGSSAAIAAAAGTEDISAVVALSPGRAYRGFDAITPATQLGSRPFLAVTAEGEPESVETARAMARITSSEAIVVPGSAHGAALLGNEEVLGQVERFLRMSLGAESPTE